MPGSVLLSHGISHTTIGAESFHFRVRDGNGWFQLAMAARQFGRVRSLAFAGLRAPIWIVVKPLALSQSLETA